MNIYYNKHYMNLMELKLTGPPWSQRTIGHGLLGSSTL